MAGRQVRGIGCVPVTARSQIHNSSFCLGWAALCPGAHPGLGKGGAGAAGCAAGVAASPLPASSPKTHHVVVAAEDFIKFSKQVRKPCLPLCAHRHVPIPPLLPLPPPPVLAAFPTSSVPSSPPALYSPVCSKEADY